MVPKLVQQIDLKWDVVDIDKRLLTQLQELVRKYDSVQLRMSEGYKNGYTINKIIVCCYQKDNNDA